MIISTLGSAFFFSVLATYLYLKDCETCEVDLSSLEWIPIISLSLVIFIASLGIISLPFVITTELMPSKVRWPFNFIYLENLINFSFTDSRGCSHNLHERNNIFRLHDLKNFPFDESEIRTLRVSAVFRRNLRCWSTHNSSFYTWDEGKKLDCRKLKRNWVHVDSDGEENTNFTGTKDLIYFVITLLNKI